jgi:hypothetical protein
MQEEPPPLGAEDVATSTRHDSERIRTVLTIGALVIAIAALVFAVSIPKPPPTPVPVRWASVASTGALEGGIGVSFSEETATGNYLIGFNSTIAKCGMVATPTGNPPAHVLVLPSTLASPTVLNLYTYSSTNQTPMNSSFTLVVYC